MNLVNKSNFDFGNPQPPLSSSPSSPDKPRGAGAEILVQIRTSIVATIVMSVLCCAAYPAVVWGLAQAIFPHQANGSLIKRDGTATNVDAEAVGSSLLGQPFADGKYFHPRPSAAGSGYDATASGGSNLGPLSAKLLNGAVAPATQPAQPPTVAYDGVKLRTLLYADENGIAIAESSLPLNTFRDDKGVYDQAKLIAACNDADHPLTFRTAQPIPPDAVTTSASGLDPHVSVENADIQAKRVADSRKVSIDRVKDLIAKNTDKADLGVFGDPDVNVLKLNIALDNLK